MAAAGARCVTGFSRSPGQVSDAPEGRASLRSIGLGRLNGSRASVREDGGIAVTEFAKRLGGSRVALYRVVNGKAAVECGAGRRGRSAQLNCQTTPGMTMEIVADLGADRGSVLAESGYQSGAIEELR